MSAANRRYSSTAVEFQIRNDLSDYGAESYKEISSPARAKRVRRRTKEANFAECSDCLRDILDEMNNQANHPECSAYEEEKPP